MLDIQWKNVLHKSSRNDGTVSLAVHIQTTYFEILTDILHASPKSFYKKRHPEQWITKNGYISFGTKKMTSDMIQDMYTTVDEQGMDSSLSLSNACVCSFSQLLT